MSYVRWSSDDFRSDVYAYESSEGYTTHVAASRWTGPMKFCIQGHPEYGMMPDYGVSDDGPFTLEKTTEGFREHQVGIGLEFDGQTFHDASLVELRDRLMMLRQLGYRVPDSAFLNIAAEEAVQEVLPAYRETFLRGRAARDQMNDAVEAIHSTLIRKAQDEEKVDD